LLISHLKELKRINFRLDVQPVERDTTLVVVWALLAQLKRQLNMKYREVNW
jgi:hypothetical protein